MHIWPAIDLLGGKAVRLREGAYDAVTDYGSPNEIAEAWSRLTPRLHLVDLDAARTGQLVQLDALREVVRAFSGQVQVGGGVRSMKAVEAYADAGASRIVVGTAAIKDPAFVREAAARYPKRIVLAVDAKNGFVATDGWKEVSSLRASDVIASYADCDLAGVLYTDISRDGTGSGPNVAATEELARVSTWPVLASGGVGSLEHIRALTLCGSIAGVVIGKALHDGEFSVAEAREIAGDRE